MFKFEFRVIGKKPKFCQLNYNLDGYIILLYEQEYYSDNIIILLIIVYYKQIKNSILPKDL